MNNDPRHVPGGRNRRKRRAMQIDQTEIGTDKNNLVAK